MANRLKLYFEALTGSLTKKLLGRYVFAMLVKTDSGMFAVDPEDAVVGRRLRTKGNWGRGEVARLKPHLTPEGKVLIVGGHIGTLAVPIAGLCRKVVAVEANPRTYELLALNVALNRVTNCTTLNVAANDADGELRFLLSRANSGGSKRVPQNKDRMYYYDNPEEVTVKAVSLDAFLPETDYDVVVMDIEGSEYFALKGMPKILSACKLLVVEFLPHHLKNVSGVTVEQFLSVVEPHFTHLTVPSKNVTVGKAEFAAVLQKMYDGNEEDDGIMFEKK